jgi:spore germination protein KB
MLPYCEIFAFMMFAPFLSKPEKIGRALRDGLFIGAGLLMFIVLRDIIVLGELAAVITQPTFATIQMIDIGGILTRLEVIYANILMILFFLKVSVVFYASVSCVRSIFGTSAHQPYIHIVGALIVIYAGASFPAVHEHVRWNRMAAATYSTFFLFVLPALTLIVAAARGGKRKPQTNQEV